MKLPDQQPPTRIQIIALLLLSLAILSVVLLTSYVISDPTRCRMCVENGLSWNTCVEVCGFVFE